jgi:RNA polymerase sigma-70 factor, ECF subfamily
MKSPVYGLALSIVKNREDAADVTQAVFLKIWRSASQYHDGTDAKAWVFKIARNSAYEQLRNRKSPLIADFFNETDLSDMGNEFEKTTERLLLDSLLKVLTQSERQIIILYTLWGYSHKEISKIMKRPYATVRWKFSNALNKLSKIVDVG